MLKNRVNDMFDKMSYEEQKEALRVLEDMDSCVRHNDEAEGNVLEVVIDAVFNAVGALGRLIFN